MENIEIKIMSESDLEDMAELSEESFLPEYNVTKVNLAEKLLKDSDRFDNACLVLRNADTNKLDL